MFGNTSTPFGMSMSGEIPSYIMAQTMNFFKLNKYIV